MKKQFCAFLLGLSLTACQSGGQSAVNHAAQPAGDAVTETADNMPQIDLSALPEDAVTVYTKGTKAFTLDDIMPLRSDSSGYSQKWEFYIYTRPYSARIKFEISNFAFSRNEGKISGYVKRHESAEKGSREVEVFKLNKKLKNGQWKAAKDRLSLDFGDYTLDFKDNVFTIHGTFAEGTFDYDIPLRAWKPGTGNVYFGNSEKNVFKFSMLSYHDDVLRGTIHRGGQDIDVTGETYSNHYATTVAVYDMFDEVSDFRQSKDDLIVMFRYYVPSAKYKAEPFGFLFAGYEGVPVFDAHEITREPLEKWLDDQNYGYEIDARQRITAQDGSNTARFEMNTARPKTSDPYADLPAFQRNVASRFAKPIEYSIAIDYELYLDVDGFSAKIPLSGSYSVTRLRE